MNPYKEAKKYSKNTQNLDLSLVYKRFLKYVQEGKLLDLGCGSGRDSLFFIKKGFYVTPSDGYKEMCLEAEQLLKREVLHLNFKDISFKEEFDAVWACASLLHLSKKELPDVLEKIEKSMKPGAYFYSSFKHGDKEEDKNNLIYNYENEKSFNEKLPHNLKLVESFITKDTLSDERPDWINFIVIKD